MPIPVGEYGSFTIVLQFFSLVFLSFLMQCYPLGSSYLVGSVLSMGL